MSIASIISLFGGLAFFLFGMSLMGDALTRVAGGKLETTLGNITSSPFKGVMLGTFVTAIIQSSSATSIMVVGFVNSGIMTLRQGIPIIMGANIGTTATGWLLSLSSVGNSTADLFSTTTIFALIAIIGIFFFMLSKNSAKKNFGVIMLSLGVLLNGMKIMSSAMDPLKDNPTFLHAMSVASNPFVCVAVGILVTALVQSCSASIGILQALSVTGVIEYRSAIYLVVGMSVGACVPVLLSAIGANKNGKRTAFSYFLFDAIGGTFFLIGFEILTTFTSFGFLQTSANSVGIAIINTIFKVFAVIVLFPIRELLVKIATKVIPDGKTDEEDAEYEQNFLDDRFLTHPAVAIEQSFRTLSQMASASIKNLNRSLEMLDDFKRVQYEKLLKREDKVDEYEDRLGKYLVKLSAQGMSEEETSKTGMILQSLTNLERISDHATNIANIAQELHDKKLAFSDSAKGEINICTEAVKEILRLTNEACENNDVTLAQQIEPLEETIDLLTERLKERHIQRLQEGRCTLDLGFLFNDIIDNLERVADHCSNLALLVIETNAESEILAHSYATGLKICSDEVYRKYFNIYKERYMERFQHEEKLHDELQEKTDQINSMTCE